MNKKFQLEVGPNTNECDINLVSISYLILSVFPDCGACGANSILFNGRCVANCPDSFLVKAGKC